MNKAIICCALIALSFGASVKEEFNPGFESNWVESSWKKDSGEAGKFVHTAGKWYGDEAADMGIQTSQDARFYAYSTSFPEFSNKDKDLVIQFSVKHEQNIDCGGGYVKVFPAGTEQATLHGGADESKYNIMFGPDICGTSTKRVHAIFSYKGKNLLIKKDVKCESDQLTHLYTLVVKSDNTYEILVDMKSVAKGNLAEDWDFLEPKLIKDPSESKPADWVDVKTIDDPEDVKPSGWDDVPAQVVDPEAEKPEDWDDEDDGEWEAPMIDNPEYKGEWKAKKIPNPEYKGEWEHPMIDNPNFKDDPNMYAYESFGVAAFELWQVKAGSIFDNLFIGDSLEEANQFAEATFMKNKDAEKAMFDKIQEEERQVKEEAQKAENEIDDEDDEEDSEDKDEL